VKHYVRTTGPDEDGENLRYPGRGQYVLKLSWCVLLTVTLGKDMCWILHFINHRKCRAECLTDHWDRSGDKGHIEYPEVAIKSGLPAD
jgi:hypothetical protein